MIASHEAASHSHSTCDLVSELQEPHCQASWDGRAVREGAAFIRRIPGPYQQPGTAAHGWQRQLEGVVTTAMHTQRLGIQEKTPHFDTNFENIRTSKRRIPSRKRPRAAAGNQYTSSRPNLSVFLEKR